MTSNLLRDGAGVFLAGDRPGDPEITVTVPSRELTTALTEVALFASPDEDDLDRHCVKIEWDGERLHFLALDGYRTAWASWGPDDIPELGKGEQEPINARYGANHDIEDPVAVTIDTGDVKEIVSSFKVDKKDGRTPISVTIRADQLTLYRSADTGFSEHRLKVRGTQSRLPDVRRWIIDAAGRVADAAPIKAIAFTPTFLADFCKVRPGKVLQLAFTEKLVLVQLGRHFKGSIVPATPEKG